MEAVATLPTFRLLRRRGRLAPPMRSDDSDAGLVEEVARGDAGALARLYDRHGAAAYGLALRIVRDPALAEDAVQEAFLAVWRGAARFEAARAKPSTWLLSLVHHKSVDLVRREQSRPPRVGEEHALERVDDTDVPTTVLRSAESAEVRRALSELTPAQREVLELAYFGGFSQSELAERIGEPIGTVKSRTHAALARLRQILSTPDGTVREV